MAAGAIIPAHVVAGAGAGGGDFIQTINLLTPARMDNRTQMQLAANDGQEARWRNGMR